MCSTGQTREAIGATGGLSDGCRPECVWLDGYNVLTTVEAALAGAVVLAGADETYRDMASMHGSYRKVAETEPAVVLIGETLAELKPDETRWLLDKPVSNSGRLSADRCRNGRRHGWPWNVDLVADPDPLLAARRRSWPRPTA